MRQTIAKTWPLFFGIAMMMIGNGLQGTLLGVRATIEGFSVMTTGVIMSAYYVGFFLGSFYIPRIISSVGHIRVFAGLASLASTTVLVHGIIVEPISWTLIRIFTGFSYAGLFLVVESWLNDASSNETRGKILGVYMVVTYLGMALGQGLLNLASPDDIELFVIISILVSLALLPISLIKRPAPDFSVNETISIKNIWKSSPLGIFGVTLAGFCSACIFAIGPVFALEIGLSNASISGFMAAFLIGCVICQMPVAHVSDIMDRRKVIIVLAFASAVFTALLFIVSTMQIWILFCVMALLGGASLPIYGQCISHVNDRLEPAQFVAASGTMLLMNGAGAVVGPLSVTLIMQIFGVNGFVAILVLVFLAIGAFGIYRSMKVKSVPLAEQGDSIIMPARGSAVLIAADDEALEEVSSSKKPSI
tara:strand:- start:1850 stop:3109 length:1260 start_codon:yes stop_codon:yes gene_type:complete